MATKKRPQYIVGVDLGGTNIVVGAMSADGKHHHAMRSIPTSAEAGADGVADRIVGLIEGVILDTIAQTDASRRDFLGVGIGAPGPLDREKGIVIIAPNLGWRNFPLRDRIGPAHHRLCHCSGSCGRWHLAPVARSARRSSQQRRLPGLFRL